MVGWHHQLNGQEFEQAPGVGNGQGSLACCRPWGRKESDMTEGLSIAHISSLVKCLFKFLLIKQNKSVIFFLLSFDNSS